MALGRVCEGSTDCPTEATYVVVLATDGENPYALVLCTEHRKALECDVGYREVHHGLNRREIMPGERIIDVEKFGERDWPPEGEAIERQFSGRPDLIAAAEGLSPPEHGEHARARVLARLSDSSSATDLPAPDPSLDRKLRELLTPSELEDWVGFPQPRRPPRA